jgi:hypothetical protein
MRVIVLGPRVVTREIAVCGGAGAAACAGFGSFILGLNKRTYEAAGVDTPGNVPGSVKEPGFGWITGFLVASSFGGLLTLIPLRKVLHFISHAEIFLFWGRKKSTSEGGQ